MEIKNCFIGQIVKISRTGLPAHIVGLALDEEKEVMLVIEHPDPPYIRTECNGHVSFQRSPIGTKNRSRIYPEDVEEF